jgi:1-acyl-sn-glycerol-3-phosphate acyltransferase
VEIDGMEHIPAQGGAILAVNHLSRLDASLVFAMIDRDDVTALVADKYKKNPFFRWLVVTVKGIWLNREEADVRALREARGFLRAGGLLGISPEGTRSRTGGLIQAKTGAAYLADKAGVPIIPIGVHGTEKALGRLLHLQRPRINLCIGAPFRLPAVERHGRETGYQHNTDEIMCRIAALLPPAYRGVYARHPRLMQILAERETFVAAPEVA